MGRKTSAESRQTGTHDGGRIKRLGRTRETIAVQKPGDRKDEGKRTADSGPQSGKRGEEFLLVSNSGSSKKKTESESCMDKKGL